MRRQRRRRRRLLCGCVGTPLRARVLASVVRTRFTHIKHTERRRARAQICAAKRLNIISGNVAETVRERDSWRGTQKPVACRARERANTHTEWVDDMGGQTQRQRESERVRHRLAQRMDGRCIARLRNVVAGERRGKRRACACIARGQESRAVRPTRG